MSRLAVDPGVDGTTVTIEIDGPMHTTARTIRSLARAVGVREVHIGSNGIGIALADLLVEELRGQAHVVLHSIGNERIAA